MSLASARKAAVAKREAAKANPKPRAKPQPKPEKRLGTGPKPQGYAGTGRPSEYTIEVGEKIAEQIALRVPMTEICTDLGISETTIYNWKLKHPEFVALVARAREFRAESRADRIDQYIEDLKSGALDPNVGRTIILAEQWQASKENHRYSDKAQVDLTSGGKPLASASDLDIAKALAHALAPALPAPEPLDVEAVPVKPEGEAT